MKRLGPFSEGGFGGKGHSAGDSPRGGGVARGKCLPQLSAVGFDVAFVLKLLGRFNAFAGKTETSLEAPGMENAREEVVLSVADGPLLELFLFFSAVRKVTVADEQNCFVLVCAFVVVGKVPLRFGVECVSESVVECGG